MEKTKVNELNSLGHLENNVDQELSEMVQNNQHCDNVSESKIEPEDPINPHSDDNPSEIAQNDLPNIEIQSDIEQVNPPDCSPRQSDITQAQVNPPNINPRQSDIAQVNPHEINPENFNSPFDTGQDEEHNNVSQSNIGEVNTSNIGEVNPSNIGEVNPSNIGEVNPSSIGEVNPSNIGEVNPSSIGEVNPSSIGEVNPNINSQSDCAQEQGDDKSIEPFTVMLIDKKLAKNFKIPASIMANAVTNIPPDETAGCVTKKRGRPKKKDGVLSEIEDGKVGKKKGRKQKKPKRVEPEDDVNTRGIF